MITDVILKDIFKVTAVRGYIKVSNGFDINLQTICSVVIIKNRRVCATAINIRGDYKVYVFIHRLHNNCKIYK